MTDYAKIWADKAAEKLKGRTIAEVRYLHPREADALGWTDRAIVLVLDNGLIIWPSRDDEGNGAGAMFTTDGALEVIPVL